jgi:uncharacterized protein
MEYIIRNLSKRLEDLLGRGKSILLLGPRQTGKTTLLARLKPDLAISFIQPRIRLQYELDPSSLADEVELLNKTIKQPLVIVDEVQKVPLIMDVVQDLIDRDLGQFILTGSSARKLKHGSQINLLPGRVVPLYLDPLMLAEVPNEKKHLEDLLLYGSLPEITLLPSVNEKAEMLEAYVSLYLEDEVRTEAMVRNLASFARFLSLAASESGYLMNSAKLSQAIGVARTTIVDYYQILEDCLIVFKVDPLTESKVRHKLSKAKKYLVFDLGVRRIAAGEGAPLPDKLMGHLFEQFVGLELLRSSRTVSSRINLLYWKDNNGTAEVDWVLQFNEQLIPVEVKYTDKPSTQDAKHLITFMKEYSTANTAFVICRIPRPRKLSDHIIALPWQKLDDVLSAFIVDV